MKTEILALLANMSRIPDDLHKGIFALCYGASPSPDMSHPSDHATPVELAKHGRHVALARVRSPLMPKAKTIYVTAPAHLQDSSPGLIQGTIRALKRIYPKAVFIDAGAIWRASEDPQEAWKDGAAAKIGSADMTVVCIDESGFVGMGIENEIDMAKTASKPVFVVRSPGNNAYFVHPEFKVHVLKGAGVKKDIPAEIRNRVHARIDVNGDVTADIIQDVEPDAA